MIAIVGMLVGIAMTAFLNYARHQNYQASAVEVFETLREARTQTLASEGDTVYGVHLSTDTITLFQGATYLAGNANNLERSLSGVTLSHALSGGVDDIIFSRRTGTTSSTGTITIQSNFSDASTTITILGTGVIEQQ